MNTTNINATFTMDKVAQSNLNPNSALTLLKEGNQRFITQNPIKRDLLSQVEQTNNGQFPHSAILSCIDSRIPTEIIFDQGIGDIFNARIAGNFVNEDILGSLEFACKLAGSKLIVIMGHTSCGAIKGACDNAELGNLTQMLAKITPSVEATRTSENEVRNSSNIDFVNRVSHQNVSMVIKEIHAKSPVLYDMVENGEINIVGAMYDVKSGEVSFLG